MVGIADGFKRCGFFEKSNWKNLLNKCFEDKRTETRTEIIAEEIEIYTSPSVADDVSTTLTAYRSDNSTVFHNHMTDYQEVGSKRKGKELHKLYYELNKILRNLVT